MVPTTLRLLVVARRQSVIWASSASMNRRGTWWAASSSDSSCGNRRVMVAAGASGIRTGSRVDSLTNNAACGRQNSAVAYQSPSTRRSLTYIGAGLSNPGEQLAGGVDDE